MKTYQRAQLQIHVRWLTPAVLESRVRGYLDIEGARFLAESTREGLDPRSGVRVSFFHDWSEMTDYESAARILLTDLARDIDASVGMIHVLVRSPLVSFGIRAAQVVVPRLKAHASLPSFEDALRAAASARESLLPR